MRRNEKPLTQREKRVLFLGGALSTAANWYWPPVSRTATREYDDGRILARQGFIRVIDPLGAKEFIEKVKRGDA